MEAAGIRALSAITYSSTFRARPLLHTQFSSARRFPSSISSSRFSQLTFSSKSFQVNALHNGVDRVPVEPVENKFLQVVLVSPQIPGNTGCIARTCAASAVKLHLVEPLGFQVDDAKLKRAGLDYWPYVVVKVHSSWSEFREYFKQEDGEKRLLAFTKRGIVTHSENQKVPQYSALIRLCEEYKSGKLHYFVPILHLFSPQSLEEFSYRKGDWLVFGSETSGLPPEALLDCKSESLGGGTIRIPMVETYVRCLNLSVSVGIALYEASRQLNYEQLQNPSDPCINSIGTPFLTEDIFA